MGATPVRIDLSEPSSLKAIPAVDFVVNAAVAKSGNFDQDLKENAEGVGFLIAQCRDVEAFLHISTTGVYQYEGPRSEEHTSELQSLMRISYAVFCLKKKKNKTY